LHSKKGIKKCVNQKDGEGSFQREKKNLRQDAPLDRLGVVHNGDQRKDVNSKLAKDGQQDVKVEDVWLRALLGKLLDWLQHHENRIRLLIKNRAKQDTSASTKKFYLGGGNEQEAATHEHSGHGYLPA
jgi:hypothetical protein